MLKEYNGKIIINWGVNVFFETLEGFLSLCLNVRGVFIIFPFLYSCQYTETCRDVQKYKTLIISGNVHQKSSELCLILRLDSCSLKITVSKCRLEGKLICIFIIFAKIII